MKKLLIVVVILAVAAGGFWFWKSQGEKKAETEEPETAVVEVSRGSLSQVVEATGSVVSNLDVEIKGKASGEVIELPFDISDQVTKGDLLIKLDTEEEERNVKKSQVSLASTRAKYERSQKNLKISEQQLEIDRQKAQISLELAETQYADAVAKENRTRELYESKLTSKEEYDTAVITTAQKKSSLEDTKMNIEDLKTQEASLDLMRKDVALAAAALESDEIDLELAKQKLGYTMIYAPMDGYVTERNVQIGTIISSGISNVGGGTTVMIISDLSRIFVMASIDESDIGSVKVGQKVMITADAYPDDKFFGEVTRIAQMGSNVSDVVTFEVKIEVLSPNKGILKPEMTANVEVMVASVRDALYLPVEAVSKRRGESFVSVPVEGGEPELRKVETGVNDGESVEIKSGLEEGEKVIVSNGSVSSKWQSQRNRGPMGGMPPMGGPPH
ncbi:MAG TPA: efflux RND transporter periplasmic adaptor subunit [bacterium]|nr:efflux RND transporter periplasmic adaptor subunit [bacterium]